MNGKKLIKIIVVFDLIIVVLLAAVFTFNQEKQTINERVRESAPGDFVQLSNGFVHYERTGPGDGELVVLVPGFSVPYYLWDPTVQGLVSEGYQVIRYDLYGRGYSDRPDAEYDLDFFVHQLSELTTTLAPGVPFHLIGLSMGGPIAASFAHQNPEQILSVSLIAPEVLLEDRSPTVSEDEIFPMNVPLLGELIVGVYLVPFHLPQSQVDDFYQPERFPDWEEKYREQIQYKGFQRAILSTIRNLVKMNPLEEYEKLHQTGLPTLLIWGKEDQSISYEAIVRLLQIIPETEVLFVEQTAHLPHYEKAEWVNTEILKFLQMNPK